MRGVAKTPNYTLEGAINVNQKVVVGREGGEGEIVLVYMAENKFILGCLKGLLRPGRSDTSGCFALSKPPSARLSKDKSR